jgi:hypothetical protein
VWELNGEWNTRKSHGKGCTKSTYCQMGAFCPAAAAESQQSLRLLRASSVFNRLATALSIRRSCSSLVGANMAHRFCSWSSTSRIQILPLPAVLGCILLSYGVATSLGFQNKMRLNPVLHIAKIVLEWQSFFATVGRRVNKIVRICSRTFVYISEGKRDYWC